MFPLIVQPTGGLCNRMRAIAGASKLAAHLGKNLLVIWTRDSSLNARFSDLFQPLPCRLIDVRLASPIHRLLNFIFHVLFRYARMDDATVYTETRGKEMSTWVGLFQRKKYLLETCHDIVQVSNPADFKDFKVSNKIKAIVETWASPVIGVHLRRSDNEISIKYSPTSLFVERMEDEIRRDSQVTFYLATDDTEEEQTLKKHFGSRVKTYSKRSLNRNNPIAIIDAVVDLYHLSQCSKIYGSYFSSFSDVAAMWGGITKETIKLENEQLK